MFCRSSYGLKDKEKKGKQKNKIKDEVLQRGEENKKTGCWKFWVVACVRI